MLKRGLVWSIFVVISALLIVACAPTATPVPRPAVPSPLQAPVTPAQATPTANSDDVAWAKVLEAAKKEGKVIVYSVTLVGDVALAIPKAFKNRYGISVEIISGRIPEITERIKTEKRMGQISADVVEDGAPGLQIMNVAGLLASAGGIPALREKDVWVVHPTAYDPEKKANLVIRLLEYAPYINTKLIKTGEAPSSWKDLLDPKWGGKMTITDPRVADLSYNVIVPLLDKKVLDEDYIKALYRQKLHFAMNPAENFRVLSNGEYSLYIIGTDGPAGPAVLSGSPIQAIDMKEGLTTIGATVAAVSGGPHSNAAMLFLNWLLESEGQTVYGKTRGNRMVRSDISDFRPTGSWVKATNRIFVTPEYSDRIAKLFQERWFDKLVGR